MTVDVDVLLRLAARLLDSVFQRLKGNFPATTIFFEEHARLSIAPARCELAKGGNCLVRLSPVGVGSSRVGQGDSAWAMRTHGGCAWDIEDELQGWHG